MSFLLKKFYRKKINNINLHLSFIVAVPTAKNFITTWCYDLASPSIMCAAKSNKKERNKIRISSIFLLEKKNPISPS
jgi:hypothetical protein